MLFNSLTFAVFMLVVFILYWMCPSKYRWALILIANCYFYSGFGEKNFLFLTAVTVISYGCGIGIMQGKKKGYVAIGLLTSVGLLIFYKYSAFLVENLGEVFSVISFKFSDSAAKLIAPVGISFYTFKVVSYLVDVAKGRMQAQTHFGKYVAYIGFFPQIASGPIERPEKFFADLEERRQFDYDRAAYALRLMAWGFFKKMIVADKLASYVDKVYANVENFSGFSLMAVMFFFTIQIYCDFSGYSDIANGTAGLLGFDRVLNFNCPYFADSVKDFWARWHVSLSTWFRDYIYIPLGGNRKGKARYALNIMITFLVSGLWHGAAWTFVIWGALHGAVQVVETFCMNLYKKAKGIDSKTKLPPRTGINRWIRVICVFVFANIAWVFFKASSLSDAMYVFSHMFDGIGSPVSYLKGGLNVLGINSSMFIHLAVVIFIVTVFDIVSLKKDVLAVLGRMPVWVKWPVYVLFIDMIIIWFLQYGADSGSFVYFNF